MEAKLPLLSKVEAALQFDPATVDSKIGRF